MSNAKRDMYLESLARRKTWAYRFGLVLIGAVLGVAVAAAAGNLCQDIGRWVGNVLK